MVEFRSIRYGRSFNLGLLAAGVGAMLAACSAGSTVTFEGEGGTGPWGTTTTTGSNAGGSNAGGGSLSSTGGNAGGSNAGGANAGGSNAGGNNAGGGNAGGYGGAPASSSSTSSTAASSSSGIVACASDSTVAQQIPLDMYIMLDQSGSMQGTKWDKVTSALKTFVNQPDAAGIGVGIQYFGLPPYGGACPSTCTSNSQCASCGGKCNQILPFLPGTCSGDTGSDSCNAGDYAKPDVEIAPLPGAAAAIVASINAHSPSTNTPTSAALQGAVDHAKAWASAHPGHSVIAVFATDGDPVGCDENQANINAIAAAAAAGSPKISTYVIGVGSSLTKLNGIAAAGGTDKAFLVDTGGSVDTQFLAAMNEIRGKALGCTYTIPTPSSGTLDYTKVNVSYTPGGGAETQLDMVADLASCPPSGDAWYYDNPASPTAIELCPKTCDKVAADDAGEVNVLLGCKTQHR